MGNLLSRIAVHRRQYRINRSLGAKHTVTFDHPMFGRKRRVVEVAPGSTEVVAVWFGNEPLQ